MRRADQEIPPAFFEARAMIAEPGFFQHGLAELSALRGQIPDPFVDDLLDGFQKLYERSQVPIDRIVDDDPLLSRTEVAFTTWTLMDTIKQENGRDFFVLDDIRTQRPDAYARVFEIDQKLCRPDPRRFSEIVTLVVQYFATIRQARTGLDAADYLPRLTAFLDSLRGFYNDKQLEALIKKIEKQLSDGVAEH